MTSLQERQLNEALDTLKHLDGLLSEVLGALADIAVSDDMDEQTRRNKARRVYESSINKLAALYEAKP